MGTVGVGVGCAIMGGVLTHWLTEHQLLLALLTVLLAAAGAAAWVLRETLGLLPGEYAARVWVVRHPAPPRVRRPLLAFVSLGRPRTAVLTVGLLMAATALAAGWRAALLIPAAGSVVTLTRALKAGSRHRCLPSGHTAYAASLFGMAACVALQTGYPVIAGALAVPAAAMGVARVFDGGHWLNDVVAGYALGLAWLLAVLLVGLPWASPS